MPFWRAKLSIDSTGNGGSAEFFAYIDTNNRPSRKFRNIAMDNEKRSNKVQSRELMMQEMTDAQRLAINQLEKFGWTLSFVRLPLFKSALPILKHPDTDHYAVLETDGILNQDPELNTRH